MKEKSKHNIVILFIRSLIFGIVVPIYTMFYSFICILSAPLPLRYRYKIVAGWTDSIIWLLKVICNIQYDIEGLENIPKDRNGVVMSKHQSTWETFFLLGRFDRVAIILKRELAWIPFFGWGMAVTSPIAINRSDKTSAMSQILTKGKKCLEEGRWVLVFPEGTRIPVGQIGKYRLGGARLATATGHPILPVAHNAGRYWPRRKFIKTPGTVKLVFGPLIETKGRGPEEVLEETKNWIEQTMLRIDGAY